MDKKLVNEITRAIDAIGCIYPSFGKALYDEPKDRLAQRIATAVQESTDKQDTLIKLMADDIRSSRYVISNHRADYTRAQIIEEFKAITGG